MSKWKRLSERDEAYYRILDQMDDEQRAAALGRPGGPSSAKVRRPVRARQGKRNGK